jgi:hypothetical protein
MTEQVNLTEEQKIELVKYRFENIEEDDLVDGELFRKQLNTGEYY